MKSYAQNKEDLAVLEYFGQFKGHLLSIGENDGISFSNARLLIENGWSADLVEPAPIAFEKLKKLYSENNKVSLHNVAISDESGIFEFHDSGEHIGNGDSSLLSTLNKNETDRWGNTTTFNKIEVECKTFYDYIVSTIENEFLFDFLTIDAEGKDIEILNQINLDEHGVKCICIEHNSIPKNISLIKDYVTPFGFKQIFFNQENVIYGR